MTDEMKELREIIDVLSEDEGAASIESLHRLVEAQARLIALLGGNPADG